eukprot:10261849-Prorocentrum_lima.AAC.1
MAMAGQPNSLSVEDLLKKYSKVSYVVASSSEMQYMAKLCEACKFTLQGKLTGLVAKAEGCPLLLHYSSDGTPLCTKKRLRGQ